MSEGVFIWQKPSRERSCSSEPLSSVGSFGPRRNCLGSCDVFIADQATTLGSARPYRLDVPFGLVKAVPSFHELMITLFLFLLTAPVSARCAQRRIFCGSRETQARLPATGCDAAWATLPGAVDPKAPPPLTVRCCQAGSGRRRDAARAAGPAGIAGLPEPQTDPQLVDPRRGDRSPNDVARFDFAEKSEPGEEGDAHIEHDAELQHLDRVGD